MRYFTETDTMIKFDREPRNRKDSLSEYINATPRIIRIVAME